MLGASPQFTIVTGRERLDVAAAKRRVFIDKARCTVSACLLELR